MKIPSLVGTIDRRILVNFRAELSVLRKFLPEPFEPLSVNGYGIVGICFFQLKDLRIKGAPSLLGYRSENSAHRISIQWEENGKRKTGVYIPRRDTSSVLNALAGGRVFSGAHRLAKFHVKEEEGTFDISFQGKDGTSFYINAQESSNFPMGSLFKTLDRASAFFKRGNIGYAPRYKLEIFDGIELHIPQWEVQALRVNKVETGFFEDLTHFPKGSIYFDHALLMKNCEHEWIERREILATRHSFRTLIQ